MEGSARKTCGASEANYSGVNSSGITILGSPKVHGKGVSWDSSTMHWDHGAWSRFVCPVAMQPPSPSTRFALAKRWSIGTAKRDRHSHFTVPHARRFTKAKRVECGTYRCMWNGEIVWRKKMGPCDMGLCWRKNQASRDGTPTASIVSIWERSGSLLTLCCP